VWSAGRSKRGTHVKDGSSARKAAARFDVGVATAIRLVRRWRETGFATENAQWSQVI